jgi:hypothetical protein
MTPLTPTQKHEQRLQMQQQGIKSAALQDKPMTETERAEALLNKRLLRQQLEADAAIAAGGLASNKTLRDEFAMAALPMIMSSENITSDQDASKYAYRTADAMLEARKTTGEGEA